MTPGRFPWERYSGEDIEAAVAIMVLREHPSGRRVRPSRGDGGVDILIPRGPGRWEVFQVKGFTTSLNSSQKRQIMKSWNRLRTFTSERAIEVTAWHVVRPLDATHEDADWLEDLTTKSGIPSDWVGLATVDGWAAKYPEVLDYYFHGGRDRTLTQMQQFLAAVNVSTDIDAETVTDPRRALTGLVDWSRTLSSMDPHYIYYLATIPPEQAEVVSLQIPRRVLSQTIVRGDLAARLDIVARYDDVHADRPPPGLQFTLAPQDDQQRADAEELLVFGAPVSDMPIRITSSTLPWTDDLNGVDAMLSVVDPPDSAIKPVDLELVDDQGRIIGILPMQMRSPRRGLDGSGRYRWNGQDRTGIVSIDLRIEPAATTIRMALSCAPLVGKRLRTIDEALRLLEQMAQATRMVWRIPDGPTLYEMGAPQTGYIDTEHTQAVLALTAVLRTLQSRIPAEIFFPDPTTFTVSQVNHWQDAAMLLQGETLQKPWTRLHVPQVRTYPELPRRMRITTPLKVMINDADWTLGHVDYYALASHWEHDGDQQGIYLYPVEGTFVEYRLAQDAEAASRVGAVHIESSSTDTVEGAEA